MNTIYIPSNLYNIHCLAFEVFIDYIESFFWPQFKVQICLHSSSYSFTSSILFFLVAASLLVFFQNLMYVLSFFRTPIPFWPLSDVAAFLRWTSMSNQDLLNTLKKTFTFAKTSMMNLDASSEICHLQVKQRNQFLFAKNFKKY